MTALLTDDVWTELDPRAGSPSRGARLRGAAIVLVAALIAIGVGTMHIKGLLTPRLSPYAATSHFTFYRASHSFDEKLTLSTSGWVDVQLRDVSVTSRGYRLLSVEGVPGVVPNDRPVVLTLRFEVTNCAHPPRVEPVLRFGVHQWWGTTHVDVQTPQTFDNTRVAIDAFMDGPAAVACGLS